MGSRHAWVDYSKGICIIGVVTLYAAQKMYEELGVAGWLQHWVDFAKPFRMPDFFLLSGLFLARVIDRPWRSYLDKKVVHYLYFFVLWSAIYFGAKVGVGRGGEGWDGHALEFLQMLIEPFAMLWFIAILPLFFVFTRLIRRVPWWVVVPVAAALQMSDWHSDAWLMPGHFADRYVFFYIGYRFAPAFFDVARRAELNPRAALVVLVAWIVVNQALVSIGLANATGLSLLTGLVGCMAVIVAGVLLSRVRWMDGLRYLGENSIVTYLAFFLPMGALIVVMKRTGLWVDPGTTAALLSAISVAFALMLFRATRATPLKLLFARPQWAHIEQPVQRALETRPLPLSTH